MRVFKVKFAGVQFKLSEQGTPDIAAREIRKGTFEPPLPAMITGTVSHSTGAFLDVGANSGVYSVLAATTRPNVNVYAFEPLPDCIISVERNIDLNDLASRVKLHKVALSDTTGTATLYLPDPEHGLLETSASLEKSFQKYAKEVVVEKTTLDELAIQEAISVIKVDIEGHEPAFLRGASKTIRKNRPIIFSEILAAVDVSEFMKFKTDFEYVSFRLMDGFVVPTPDVQFDMQSWNWAFVPHEKLTFFYGVCSDQGLEVTETPTPNTHKSNPIRQVRSFLGRSFVRAKGLAKLR
ncbi:FkbM family methyltransferase [Phyllobacterium sp. 22229]|uniref:FkbM family methyltransferase n=1 Tax=Phyllobacterium sp. 22229 TaxID=3453895 RepID=UPI003F871206